MPPKRIYLDNTATTPLDAEVFKAMLPYLQERFGNASSLHSFGQEALAAVDKAREQVAHFLDSKAQEIVFTSGATESDNLALKGVMSKIKSLNFKVKNYHLITSSIEHPAVLEPARALEKEGIEVTILPVTKKGLVRIEDVEKAIEDKTVLISIMYVNNEVGTIQPIKEIGKVVQKVRATRKKEKGLPIVFHSDAAQALNYCNSKVDELGVDLMSISSHKIYGPKGIGALYVRKGTPLSPILDGGHHEYGLRSGTLNVAAIVGLGKAIEQIQDPKSKVQNQKIKRLRDKLIEGILKTVAQTQLNGDQQARVPNNAHFSFRHAEGESLMLMLDMEGIAVSTGSACASGTLEASHVLRAMGVPSEISHGSLRITLGKYTTESDIEKILEVLPPIVSKLRKIAPQ